MEENRAVNNQKYLSTTKNIEKTTLLASENQQGYEGQLSIPRS